MWHKNFAMHCKNILNKIGKLNAMEIHFRCNVYDYCIWLVNYSSAVPLCDGDWLSLWWTSWLHSEEPPTRLLLSAGLRRQPAPRVSHRIGVEIPSWQDIGNMSEQSIYRYRNAMIFYCLRGVWYGGPYVLSSRIVFFYWSIVTVTIRILNNCNERNIILYDYNDVS